MSKLSYLVFYDVILEFLVIIVEFRFVLCVSNFVPPLQEVKTDLSFFSHVI